MTRKNKIWIGVLILILLSFIPAIPFSVVTPITLQIVDELGDPLPDISIQQTWRHYTFQFGDGIDHASSNEKGTVIFPERIEYFSLAQILFGELLRLAQFMNPHASFGPSSFFLPRGNVSGSASYRPDHPLPTEMVVKR